ncbi:MAG: alpha/beta hydrolase [Polyangiales bacterium]
MAKRSPLPEPRTFDHGGRRIAYRELGSGPRVIVLVHGLLMDVRMFTLLAPTLAAAGNRVILCDMLGHGASEQPHDMGAYSMPQFGADVIALLDHLGVAQAVVGGTSLGANVALEAAVHAPERVRGLMIEMPVLESGIAAAGAVFVPLALALRVNPVGMGLMAGLARLVPRTHWIIDMGLDTLRRDTRASLAVLDGLTFGRIAPPRELRRTLRQPALVVGHVADPIHPFADAGKLAEELVRGRLVTARSAAEWRVMPKRLDGELSRFLDMVWGQPQSVARAAG